MVDWESGSERKRENERGFWSWKACPHITCLSLSLSLSLSYHMQGHSHGRWTGGQPFCLNSIYIAIWHKGSLSFTLPSNLVHISFIWLHSTLICPRLGPNNIFSCITESERFGNFWWRMCDPLSQLSSFHLPTIGHQLLQDMQKH